MGEKGKEGSRAVEFSRWLVSRFCNRREKISKANSENKFVTVGNKPSMVGREPNFVGSCRPLKDWGLDSQP